MLDLDPASRRAFQKSWQCLAHVTQFARPGDYVADTVVGFPIILVQGADGDIRAFRNACRHRLSPLTQDGTGSCGEELVCPYHGWRFMLDGRLRSATRFGALEGFDVRSLGLIPLPSHVWRGWIFVGLSADVPDFTAWFAPIAARTAHTPMEAWRYVARRRHDVACRWSLYVENYLEGYHVPAIHPALDAEIESDEYRVEVEDRVAIHHAPLRHERRNDSVYDGLWGWAWPNLGINVYPNGMMMERIWPLGPRMTRLDYLYVFADPEADQTKTFIMSDAVTNEDRMICEMVETNVAAGDIGQGPLSPRHERAVQLFRDLFAAA